MMGGAGNVTFGRRSSRPRISLPTYNIPERDPDTSVTTVSPNAVAGYRDGPLTNARFEGIRCLARDWDNAFVVVETAANRIRRIGADGNVITIASKMGSRYDELHGPVSVAVLGMHQYLVVDAENHRIQLLYLRDGNPNNPKGWQMRTISGWGEPGNTDGRGQETRYNFPRSIAKVGQQGYVIADESNNTLRWLQLKKNSDPMNHLNWTSSTVTAKMQRPCFVAASSKGDAIVVASYSHNDNNNTTWPFYTKLHVYQPDGSLTPLTATGNSLVAVSGQILISDSHWVFTPASEDQDSVTSNAGMAFQLAMVSNVNLHGLTPTIAHGYPSAMCLDQNGYIVFAVGNQLYRHSMDVE